LANSPANDFRKFTRTGSSSASIGSAIAAKVSRRLRNARSAKVMMQQHNAESGPGASSPARRSAPISRAVISASKAATRSVLPGKYRYTVPAAIPARRAIGAICTAAIPASLAASRAAVMIEARRAASRRSTFSVRR
jgi:hypothetical protein